MVTLRPIDSDNYEECIRLSVKPEQKKFIAANENGLAMAYVFRDIFRPYAVYDGEQMVGFTMLSFDSRGGFWIMRFMTDGRYQNRGCGRAAMALVLDEFRKAGAKRVRLCVEEENRDAQRFYAGFGFARNGAYIDGEPVMELTI